MSIHLWFGKSVILHVIMRLAVYFLFFLPAWVFSQTSGLVIDQQTRLPLENVRVVLPDSSIIHTNIAGIFYLPELEADVCEHPYRGNVLRVLF